MGKIKNEIVRILTFGAPALIAAKFFVGVASAAAATLPPSIASNSCDVYKILNRISGVFFSILMTLSVIMALYAAYNYVTARDDTEKTERARRTLTYAAIGVVVALIAAGFPTIVWSIVGTQAGSFNNCSTQ